jgi:hypothetical protein
MDNTQQAHRQAEIVCALAYCRKSEGTAINVISLEDLRKTVATVPMPFWGLELAKPREVLRQTERLEGFDYYAAPVVTRAAHSLVVAMAERPGVLCCAVCKRPMGEQRKIDVIAVLRCVSDAIALMLARCEGCNDGSPFDDFVGQCIKDPKVVLIEMKERVVALDPSTPLKGGPRAADRERAVSVAAAGDDDGGAGSAGAKPG